MKIFVSIALSLFVLLAAVTVTAQVNNQSFSKPISISTKEVRIDSLLMILKKQTGIEFSFNSNKISPLKKLSVPGSNQTLSQWLITLKTKAGIEHKVIGNHIILVDKKQPQAI